MKNFGDRAYQVLWVTSSGSFDSRYQSICSISSNVQIVKQPLIFWNQNQKFKHYPFPLLPVSMSHIMIIRTVAGLTYDHALAPCSLFNWPPRYCYQPICRAHHFSGKGRWGGNKRKTQFGKLLYNCACILCCLVSFAQLSLWTRALLTQKRPGWLLQV